MTRITTSLIHRANKTVAFGIFDKQITVPFDANCQGDVELEPEYLTQLTLQDASITHEDSVGPPAVDPEVSTDEVVEDVSSESAEVIETREMYMGMNMKDIQAIAEEMNMDSASYKSLNKKDLVEFMITNVNFEEE